MPDSLQASAWPEPEPNELGRKLNLIHKVVQRIVGMMDEAAIAQTTAEMMAEYFDYELAIILVGDATGENLINLGIGGSKAHLIARGTTFSASRGITGRVFRSGKSCYATPAFQEPDYYSIPEWIAGSEICVPLSEGEHTIGVINLERTEKDSASPIDYDLIQSLAGILSSVMMNARRYQLLQKNIEAMQRAESRLIRSETLATAGRLTASIAHEINNPLQALNNCLYLAERYELSPEERHKNLAIARRELDRLVTTVQRMLDFYRPGARSRSMTDVNIMIEHVVTLLEPQLKNNQIRIHKSLDPSLGLVLVVAGQIHQVLLNLLINAMDSMPGGGEIFIQTAPLTIAQYSSNEDRHIAGLEITIQDTGPGIPLEEREHLFEPILSTKENGTGLGLAISSGIIQAHGGSITLIDTGERGACFRINLPEGKDDQFENLGS